MMDTWLVFGATSGIAVPVVRQLAKRGHSLLLAARDEEHLKRLAGDLRARYQVEVTTLNFDANDLDGAEEWVRSVDREHGPIEGVFWATGYLGDQAEEQERFAAAKKSITINFLAAVAYLHPVASLMQKRKRGHIVAIGSVAGDRGRMKNYIYGSAKSALNRFLQGMMQRLYRSGVAVTIVKPGFVNTKMTQSLDDMFLVAEPSRVAADIVRGIEKRSEEVYTPWFWWGIMHIIRHIPVRLFKRLSL
ncbi:SDR family oxidoreductase [bacterium]|nr:SDR family oxidoreductase [bacterium]